MDTSKLSKYSTGSKPSSGEIKPAHPPISGVLPATVYQKLAIFPPRITCEAADPQDVNRLREGLGAELIKYPSKLLGSEFVVMIVKNLKIDGVNISGTYTENAVIISSESLKTDEHPARVFTETELREVLHSEISSTLFHAHVFPLDKWAAANPTDFVYRGSGLEAVRSKHASTFPQRALLNDGFLAEYGQASIEEDVNLYAATMMSRPNDLRAFCQQYPRIEQKVDTLRRFLLHLSPEMKQTYPAGFE